ncbi:E3 ubiquitin- ligase TRIM39-like protein [Labeo rohita]|uniref:E3 ubiquitin-ligase TRIM39-like protein n=1 Tax=Labeo rohita TaxID=84645 RepID=A0A498MVT6_LABRO|nr:E3 ubiquitin- ligase TRIM39-like protein [Labeo rohita]
MIQKRIKKIQDIKHSAEVRKISSSLCSPTNTRNWPEISMKTHVSLETLRRALTQLQHTLDEKLTQTELKRMQQYAAKPSNGYWTVALRNGYEYAACAGPSVSLYVRVKPQRVGVFVDYEEGLVSFYDVESSSHIYSYTVSKELKRMQQYAVLLLPNGSFMSNLCPVHFTDIMDYDLYLRTQLMKTQKDVQQMIKEKIKKIQDIKHSAEVRKISSSLCSPTNTRNWPEISMKTHVSLETLRRALTQLQHTLDEKLTKIVSTELKRMQQYAASPIDGYWTVGLRYGFKYTARAGPSVSLSLRVKPQRVGVFVDYEEGLVSFYDVESSSHIYSYTARPSDGYWTVAVRNGYQYIAFAGPPVSLCVRVNPQQVGVFVDYEEGLVSFYDVESSSHIYSYTGQSFTDTIRI